MPSSRRSPSVPKGAAHPARRSSDEGSVKIVRDVLKSFFLAQADPGGLDQLRLFGGAGLAKRERKILERIIDSTNVVRTGRRHELARKLDRIGRLLLELLSRGIAPADVLDAVDLPVAECELATLEYLIGLRRRLAQERTGLRSVIRYVDRLLPQAAQVRMDVWVILKAELDRTAPAYSVIKKVLANGSIVLRKTKNPLVQLPPVNLLRLLLRCGMPKAEACRLTARFLTQWEPERFKRLQPDHVRRRYGRLARVAAGR
jgi:hypothetical protein